MKKSRANPCCSHGDGRRNPAAPETDFSPQSNPLSRSAQFARDVWELFDLDEVEGEDEPRAGDFWIEPEEPEL